MAPGVDKVIAFDPPGTIGLPTEAAIALLRFNEVDASERPHDDAGLLADLDVVAGLTMPSVVDGAVGRARLFVPSSLTGLVAADLVSGNTLLTRDATVQVVVAWTAAIQGAVGAAGTIVARGKGGSSAEYVCYGLEIAVVDAASGTGTLRWLWQDTAGVLKTQAGADFSLPAGFTLLTATRRWVSPTEVVLRYYIGDLLLGEVTSVDGSIGGGTTGTLQVGTRYSGAAFGAFFAGAIDELLVLDHALTHEEIEATWLRITKYQPLGYQLLKELHDPGFPISTDPASDVQLDTRMQGHALGYAAAQSENLRANFLPTRAYGSVLEDWEATVESTPGPNQSIEERRARVVALLRQKRGCAIDGLKDALQGLVGIDVDELEFLAFDNTIRDGFTTLEAERWDVQPAGAVTAVAGAAHFAPGAGDFTMTGATQSWVTMPTAVGGDGREAHVLVKVVFTTPRDTAEAGIYLGDWARGNFLLLGLRDVAGSFKVVSESFIAFESQGLVVQSVLGANPAALWLHVFQTTASGTFTVAWSTTSGIAGFATANVTHPTLANLGGCYLRSVGAIAAPVADFDDIIVRAPYGDRTFNAYVYRDPGLGSTTDVEGGHLVIAAIKHAYTEGTLITSKSVLCDDDGSLLDRGPMGGI